MLFPVIRGLHALQKQMANYNNSNNNKKEIQNITQRSVSMSQCSSQKKN